MKCDRCGKASQAYELFDYCVLCGNNLCPECAEAGCCDHSPAISGNDADLDDSD